MNYLIGFEGLCGRCKQNQRIYYYYADREHRQKMIDGSIFNERSNCPACVTSKIIQTPHTMKWQRKLSPKEVEADLTRLNGGIQIDFKQAEELEKEYAKNDAWLENQSSRVAEYQAWKRKTEGGIQKLRF